MPQVQGDIRHLEKTEVDELKLQVVQGDIRHLEINQVMLQTIL